MRLLSCFAVLLLALSGCMSYRPYVKFDGPSSGPAANPFLAATPEDAAKKTRLMATVLKEALHKRRNADFFTSEVAFYGTLVTAGGVAKESIAARNTGGVVTALATLIGGRYNLTAQRAAIRKALRRTTCIERKLMEAGYVYNPTKDEVTSYWQADLGGKDEVLTALGAVTVDDRTIASVSSELLEDIANELQDELDALQLKSMTQAEMVAIFENARKAKEETVAKVASGVDKKFLAIYSATVNFRENATTCLVN